MVENFIFRVVCRSFVALNILLSSFRFYVVFVSSFF